jgi:hypothetical protein
MAICLTAAGIKLSGLNLLPYHDDLVSYLLQIVGRNNYLLLPVLFLFVGLYKIKFGTNGRPAPSFELIDQYFIENSLSPVIASQGLFGVRAFEFGKSFVWITGLIIDHIHRFTIEFQFVELSL